MAVIDQAMGDGFRLHEKMGHDAAVEISWRTDAETCCFVQQQGVVRHEEERAGVVTRRIVVPPKLVALEFRDSLGAQVEHDFVMRLQRLAEPREINHDDACCHGSRPFINTHNPRWPLSGTPESALSLQRADPSRPGTRARSPDAAEGRLRQVYAELGGMIGGNHKSERCMLPTRSAGMVDASHERWTCWN